MAKSSKISIFEQHVEKGVLGLSAIFLIVATVWWILQSPREIEVSSIRQNRIQDVQPAPPDQVDAKIRELAEGVKKYVAAQPPRVSPPPDYVERMRKRQACPLPSGLLSDATGLGQPPIPGLRPTPPSREPVSMEAIQAAIPAPSDAPLAVVDRELSRRATGEQAATPVSKIVAHVVLAYPRDVLTERWNVILKDAQTSTRVVVGNVEIQSQVLKSNGEWTDRDVQMVCSDESAEPIPALPAFTGDNQAEVLAAVNDLQTTRSEAILRPAYWQIYNLRSGQWEDWTGRLPEAWRKIDRADLVWRHDEGVQAERQYRYRYRLALVSPIFGFPLDAGESSDAAAKPYLLTDWSPWSEPSSVTASTRFFVQSATADHVKAIVFTDALGQIVKKEFRTDIGRTIGELGQAQISIPDRPDFTTDVDYRTGAILVGLKEGKGVFSGRLMRTSVEVIYLDGQGELQSRVLLYDQQDQAAYQSRRP